MRPALAFLAVTLIWGSTFLVIGFANETLPPLWGATLRLAIAGTLLAMIAALSRTPFPRGAALRAAIGFGVFQFGFNFALLYLGQTRVPSGVASVLFALIPLTNALAARAAGLERLSAAKITGAMMALLGVLVLSVSQIRGRIEPWALLCVLLAVLAGTAGTVLLKLGPRQSAIGANLAGTWTGILITAVGSFLLGESHALPRGWNAWAPLLYLSTFGSIGAFVLFAYLIERWPISRVGYISVCVPVLALALGALVRGERLPPEAWLGTVIILGGVVVGLRATAGRAAGAPPRAQAAE